MKRLLLILFTCISLTSTIAQDQPDQVIMKNISGVKLYQYGNQLGYPIISLNSGEQLELHFDDLDGRVKNYNYTFQLCNADWSPVNLSTFDYLKGFSQVRLNQYRASSLALTRYIHYQAILPDRNCVPTRSGNYLLKVFLDGDINKLAFTKRILVVDKATDIGIQILQPFNTDLFSTHQKVQFIVNKRQLNVVNPVQQIKAVVLQNFRWDNAKTNIIPTFIRQSIIEFNAENDAVFAAGKEFRWADLRSFRLQSDRVKKADYGKTETNIYMQPDGERSQQRFVNFRDYNGFFFAEASDVSNPWWQSDYASVHFSYVPTNNQPYPDKKVFIVGEMNQYNTNDTAAMKYNADKGLYEKTLLLKQGYYSYTYITRDAGNRRATIESSTTDGNLWETENDYTVLIYYRSLAGRHDELIGVSSINSLNSRRVGF